MRLISLFTVLMLSPIIISGTVLPSEHKTSIYISKVTKEAFGYDYLARIVREDHYLVLSKRRIKDASLLTDLKLSTEESLLSVEMTGPEPKLPGEVFRVENRAFLKMWKIGKTKNAQTHLHFGDLKNHVRLLNLDNEKKAQRHTPKPTTADFDRSNDMLGRFRDIDVDVNFLRSKLNELSGEIDAQIGGVSTRISERGSTDGRNKARLWLAQEYNALGFITSEQSYRTGINFVAEKTGADPTKVIILSAHLDSANNPGADDDGTGTISALAIAKALADLPLKYNLRILGFDQEEQGLFGSAAYVKYLKEIGQLSSILGVYNLEMTGYDADHDGAFHVIDCNEGLSANLSRVLLDTISQEYLALKKIAACTDRSDHASFWEEGISAVVVSQNFFGRPSDSNPCYHRKCDRTDILNFDYMRSLALAVAYTLEAILLNSRD